MSNVKENILTTLRSTQREHIGLVKDAEEDACHCHLCYIVHLADRLSAKSYRGSSITKI